MKYIKWFIAITLIALIVSSIVLYKQTLIADSKQNNMGEPTATITTLVVDQSQYQPTLTVKGVNQARQTLNISNELAGTISQLYFSSGETVKQDDILLILDHRIEQAQLTAAKAKLALQEKVVRRYEKLFKTNKISEEKLEEALTQQDVFRADIAVLETVIDKKIIKAPFDGMMDIHDLQVGQYLTANSQVAQIIGSKDYSWIDFHIPQHYPKLVLNTKVLVTTPDADNQGVTAQVASVSPVFTHNTRHLKYRAKLLNADLVLRHNHMVNVTVPIAEVQQKIHVPNLALVSDRLSQFVYLINQDEQGTHRAYRQEVKVLARKANHVVIESGLSGGELIALEGSFKLWPTIKVNIVPAANTTTDDNATQSVQGASL
ncbi:efflux RND transporter periplasmic adaptor subunit [Flocculibacter collagenilyticus]|uniref:efflux RND transporter periplasmic adaptor subunit n=1 Tax=Flocculibacter collagenilyticus TaxID=2744479 RepID=UPI0018F3E556|nr:efflux RND transporter periplasmic adaptor subunit [Flocculibacter collagenilyticus]